MNGIRLTLRKTLDVPVEAGNISPRVFAGRSLAEIEALPLRRGNRSTTLSALFDVTGTSARMEEEVAITLEGDAAKLRWIGHKMRGGQVMVKGSAGFYLGEEMSGGEIVVEGNAGSWAGSLMSGGRIEIRGSAGHYLGGGYRGCSAGMTGGSLVVHRGVGDNAGYLMAGGVITIRGNAGQFTGVRMKEGHILVEGDAESRIGALMTGGRIAVRGRVASILPSFSIDEVRSRVRIGDERVQGPFYVFKGDVTESWNGSLYISIQSNPHLKPYESKIA